MRLVGRAGCRLAGVVHSLSPQRAPRPLAEGAVLKKKFDDIFAATKYTKALETIRKLKTDQAQGIRVCCGDL